MLPGADIRTSAPPDQSEFVGQAFRIRPATPAVSASRVQDEDMSAKFLVDVSSRRAIWRKIGSGFPPDKAIGRQ
jgi:hypothetical protein